MSKAAPVPDIDIRPDHWDIVHSILQKHVPQYAVWAFGSRAKWTAKPYSDLDLAIITDNPLSLETSAALADDFSESDLPWKVDIVDWATISESFRRVIERDKVGVRDSNNNVKGKWKVLAVEEVCELIVDCVNKTAPVVDEQTPYRMIRTPNIRNGRVDLDNCRFVNQDTYAKWTRRAKLQNGDVILTREAPIGEVGFIQEAEGVFLGQRLMQYRANKALLEPRFLLYCFLSPALKNQFGSYEGSGSVVSHIRVGDCFKFKIPVPELKEQRAIVHILGTLDDKIDLNRRMNQTLEAMAQAIFKSWFVDFDPVKAKIAAIEQGQDPLRAAMRVISGKTDAELDQMSREEYDSLAATAALFPEEMQESELGEIPKGWGVKSVSDLALFATGKIEVSSLTVETYISTENMLENRRGINRATSLPGVTTVPTFKKGNVLISNIRPYFKKIWLAHFDGGRSNDVLCLEAKEEGCEEFLYNLLYQDEFFEFMMRTSKGAKMPRGDKNAIAGWAFPSATFELRCVFSERVRPFYSYIENSNLGSRELSELRDALLPKLLSGELDMGEVIKEKV